MGKTKKRRRYRSTSELVGVALLTMLERGEAHWVKMPWVGDYGEERWIAKINN